MGRSTEFSRRMNSSPVKKIFEISNTEHPADGLIYDPTYLGIERSDDIVFIQITLNMGRSVEQKRVLYRRIAELLGKEPGVRPEDVLVNLVEVAKENWSFGNGEVSHFCKRRSALPQTVA